jgi:hypothetical protein
MGKRSGGGSGRGGGATGAAGTTAIGIDYVLSPGAKTARHVGVLVDVAKLDAAWKKDGNFRINVGGTNGIGDRYGNAKQFINTTGNKVRMPEVAINKTGRVIVKDGRHRLAAIRDSGKQSVYVSATPAQAKKLKELFAP